MESVHVYTSFTSTLFHMKVEVERENGGGEEEVCLDSRTLQFPILK
jgi:hypothetical protein